MSYKKFVYIITGLFTCLFIVNIAISNSYDNKFMDGLGGHGDLGRLGYFYIPQAETKQKTIDKRYKHIEMPEYISNNIGKQMDIITIGDSFFNGGGGYYFQDILIQDSNASVLNITPMKGYEAFDMALLILSNGYVDIIKPRYIIIESVERSVCIRYGKNIDFNKFKNDDVTKDSINNYYINREKVTPLKPNSGIIDPRMFEINTKFIKSMFNYQRNKGYLNELVYYANLKLPLFSNSGKEKLLLYYHDDVKNYPTTEQVIIVNDNFNKLAKLCNEKGVQLIFMPAVDKYDLYYDFIKEPRYPPNKFFESISELPKDYTYIDTKKILTASITNGQLDTYWGDDTHWGWKGQVDVAKELAKIVGQSSTSTITE